MKTSNTILKYSALFFLTGWKILFFFLPVFALLNVGFSSSNFMEFFSWALRSNLIIIFFRSIMTACITAFICLIIGYIIAYILFKRSKNVQTFLLIILAIPFLTNFIVHLAAWNEFLATNGYLSQMLLSIGIQFKDNIFLYGYFGIIIGFVYCYMPFMIFPLFNALQKFDITLLKASYDLGASVIQTIFRVLVPETKHAILTGFFLVFIPASCEFVIPEILGGDRISYCGSIIYNLILSPSLTSYAALVIIFFIIALSFSSYVLYVFINKVIFFLERI